MATLLDTPSLRVLDVACKAPRSGPGAERAAERPHLVLMRRGTFGYHRGSAVFMADLCTALFYDGRADYRLSHPADGGDDCTVIELAPALVDELFKKEAPVELRLSPRTQLLHQQVHARRGDRLAREELVLDLLQTVARERPLRGAPERRTVTRAKALLSARLDENLGLTELAEAAGCSPCHLMRLFRAETGCSLRAYRRQLRVIAALERLRAGEADLTTLALDVGFASHSHLTESFRRALGASPSAVRRALGS